MLLLRNGREQCAAFELRGANALANSCHQCTIVNWVEYRVNARETNKQKTNKTTFYGMNRKSSVHFSFFIGIRTVEYVTAEHANDATAHTHTHV